jgi:hypothetical protein
MIDVLATLLGYVAAVFGGGIAVERVLGATLADDDLDSIQAFRKQGLRDGGRLIGWLERFLFYSFLLNGQYAAVGFVLAAKGVARYGEIKEAKDQKVAEYVLIGTMISLSWTLAVFGAVQWLKSF